MAHPWAEYRAEGNSFFVFRFVLSMVSMVAVFGLIAGCMALAWGDIRAEQFGGNAIAAIVIGVVGIVLVSVPLGILNLLLVDFVVPIMYMRRIKTLPALGVLRHELLRGHVGWFVLFYLMYFLLSIAAAIVATVATCLTCCIAAIPYLGTVILLPIFVFLRCYSLYFLQQFGPEWLVFYVDPADPCCSVCNYDLRASLHGPACPECGAPIRPSGPLPQIPPPTAPPTQPLM